MTRENRITLALTGAGFAAWLWVDAFLTILERTGAM